MRRPSYDASEDTLHVPLSVEEVDRYLAAGGRPFGRDRKIKHLLWRARVTLAGQQQDLQNMRRAVEQLSVKRTRSGTPTTLSPVDALKFASPEEIAQIVDRLSQAQLKQLQRLVTEAQAQRAALVADLAKVRGAATELINRADLPAGVRTEFARLLSQVPARVPDVTVPKVLEMLAATEAQNAHQALPGAAPVRAAAALPAGPSTTTAPGEAGRAAAPTVSEQPAPAMPPTATLPQYGTPPSWRGTAPATPPAGPQDAQTRTW